MKNGSIAAPYKADGSPLARVDGWGFESEGLKLEPGDDRPEIRSFDTPDGNHVFEINRVTNKAFAWSQRITCRPGGLRVDYAWTPAKTLTGQHHLKLGIKMLQPLTNDIGPPPVHPVEALTEHGAVTISFDQRVFHWYEGYGVWGHERPARLRSGRRTSR